MNNSELIYTFLSSSQTDKNLSQRTIKAYTYDLILFDKFVKPNKIVNVNTNIIREYLQTLQERGLKSTSIKRKLATLKVFFSFLEDEEIIDNSPTNKFKGKFKTPKRLPRILSRDEIQKVLNTTSEDIKNNRNLKEYKKYQIYRNRAIVELLFCTGIRIDELIKLNLNDIDLQNKTLIINGKGNKERLIYLSSIEVINFVGEYKTIRRAIPSDSNGLFLNNRYNRLSVHSIGNIFKYFLKKCNIEKNYTPHCLRHTMATLLIENGADIRSVQEILGHSSISTTEIYISVSKHRKKEVMEKFNQRNLIMIS